MASQRYFLYFRDGDPPIFLWSSEEDNRRDSSVTKKIFDEAQIGDWCCNYNNDPTSRIFQRRYVPVNGRVVMKWEWEWLHQVDIPSLPSFVQEGLAMAFLLP